MIAVFLRSSPRLSSILHEARKKNEPFVDNLGESSRSGSHQNLTNSIVELLDTLIGDSEETLSSSLLGLLVRQIPNTILERELLVDVSNLGENSYFKVLSTRGDMSITARLERMTRTYAHGEEKLRVVLGIN